MEQIDRIVALVRDVLGDDVIGAYLHGSAVLGGLRPHSDLDVLVVSRRPTADAEKRALIDRLLRISGRGDPSGKARPIELTIVVESEIRPWRYPPRLDFQYGDWWRAEFERGELAPWMSPSPDLAPVITMVLNGNWPVFGPPPADILEPLPWEDVNRAIVEGIPGLLDDLDADTGNVVLTFARIWTTLDTGTIRSKDAAADWALARLPQEHRPVLARARAIYLGDEEERWDDLRPRIRPHVDHVLGEIKRLAPLVGHRTPGPAAFDDIALLSTDVARWLQSVVGRDSRIRRVRSLDASSATVLAIEVEREGSRRGFVLRLHDRAWFLEDGATALAREAAALTLIAEADIPAPRLVAWSDREPSALVMTAVEGVPELALPDAAVVRDLLDRIHDLPPDALAAWSYRGYHEGIDLPRPAWWRDARTWERAVQQTGSARPAFDPVVIHRDFHPGNVLWVGGRLAGVVDWVDACVGPAAFDASHMRVNLAVLHGPDEPDRVIPGDPAWDIEAALGFLDWASPAAIADWPGPWPHLPAHLTRSRLEAFVAESLARLG